MAEVRFQATVNWMTIHATPRGLHVECACGYRGPVYGTTRDADINVEIHRKLCPKKISPKVGAGCVHVGMVVHETAVQVQQQRYGGLYQ
jgi:hypothetical protein